jgi:hypothetical protein
MERGRQQRIELISDLLAQLDADGFRAVARASEVLAHTLETSE